MLTTFKNNIGKITVFQKILKTFKECIILPNFNVILVYIFDIFFKKITCVKNVFFIFLSFSIRTKNIFNKIRFLALKISPITTKHYFFKLSY